MPQWFLWTELAKAQLRGIDRATAMRILVALNRLRSGHGDVENMVGYQPPCKRFRVGDYRIIFREIGDGHFEIREIGKRENIYK